jgi:hypothetical protein
MTKLWVLISYFLYFTNISIVIKSAPLYVVHICFLENINFESFFKRKVPLFFQI